MIKEAGRTPTVGCHPPDDDNVVEERLLAPPSGGSMTSRTTSVAAQREPELRGQTVVVIGGSAGIGLETARRARAEGADVIITGRNPERLQHAALELAALSTAAFDATDPAPLSASLLGDDLEMRRDQLRATIPI